MRCELWAAPPSWVRWSGRGGKKELAFTFFYLRLNNKFTLSSSVSVLDSLILRRSEVARLNEGVWASDLGQSENQAMCLESHVHFLSYWPSFFSLTPVLNWIRLNRSGSTYYIRRNCFIDHIVSLTILAPKLYKSRALLIAETAKFLGKEETLH